MTRRSSRLHECAPRRGNSVPRFFDQTRLIVLAGSILIAVLFSAIGVAGGAAGLLFAPALGFASVWMLLLAVYGVERGSIIVRIDQRAEAALAETVDADSTPRARAQSAVAAFLIWTCWGIALYAPVALQLSSSLPVAVSTAAASIHALICMAFCIQAIRSCAYASCVAEETLSLVVGTNAESAVLRPKSIMFRFRDGEPNRKPELKRGSFALTRIAVPSKVRAVMPVSQKRVSNVELKVHGMEVDDREAVVLFDAPPPAKAASLQTGSARRGSTMVWWEWSVEVGVSIGRLASSTIRFRASFQTPDGTDS